MSEDQFPYEMSARMEQARQNRRHQFFGPDGGFSLFDGQHKMPELTPEYKAEVKNMVIKLRHSFGHVEGDAFEDFEMQQRFLRRFKVVEMMCCIEALLDSK